MNSSSSIKIEHSICSRSRFNLNECELCKKSCPKEAVVFGDKLKLTRKCNGCMQCTAVCPTGALEANKVNYNDLINKLQEVEFPVLGCSNKPEANGHARVPCLGMISLEMSIFMISSLKKEVQLNLTQCEGCECDVTEHLKNIKAALPSTKPSIELILDSSKLNFKEKNFSRRSFFSIMVDKGKAGTSEILQAKFKMIEEEPYVKKRLPIRVQMINNAEKLGDQALKDWIDSNLRFELSYTDKCDFCGECRAICPTGAIKLQKGDEEKLLFKNEKCSGCQLCVEFCPLSCLNISKKKRIKKLGIDFLHGRSDFFDEHFTI
ncbi:MAG: 4Fe-4S binding protein [Bacteriovoracaceae bacterium]|nr:4Fe-4S binding protein [Bacteriovoracaceae bacterium]